jgi:hypothetical protein
VEMADGVSPRTARSSRYRPDVSDVTKGLTLTHFHLHLVGNPRKVWKCLQGEAPEGELDCVV